MIKATKVYLDKNGGARLYIPYELVQRMGWINKSPIILTSRDSSIKITNDEDSGEKKLEAKP